MAVTSRAATFVLKDIFQLNGFETGAQFGSSLIALSGGGFAVAHGNHFISTDTPALSIFTADGTPVQTETGTYVLPFDGAALSVQMAGAPVIAQDPAGMIRVLWVGAAPVQASQNSRYIAGIDPVDGAIIQSQVFAGNTRSQSQVALVITDAGHMANMAHDPQTNSVDLSLRQTDGTHITSFGAIGNFSNAFGTVDLVKMSGGGLLLGVTEITNGPNNPIHLQYRMPEGFADGAMFLLDPVGSLDASPDIHLAALPDDGFAIAYARDFGGSPGVAMQIVPDPRNNPDGTGPVRVDADLAAVEGAVDLAVLPNGWLVVAWITVNGDGTTDLLARVFDQAGAAQADPVLVSTGTSNATDPSLAVLADGRVAVSWTDTLPDSDGDSIRGKIIGFGLETRGDDAADLIQGLELQDLMRGGKGRDHLIGLGGNDMLFGGAGGDRLDGGAGNDDLNGGLGKDTAVFGGDAKVTVDLANSDFQQTGRGKDRLTAIENVIAGRGDDVLAGDDARNVLKGGAGADALNGRGGDDLLIGGAGDDLIAGGAGADVMKGGGGFDTAVFSGKTQVTVNLGLTRAQDTGRGRDQLLGIENVTTGAGDDLIAGNADNNVLNGAGGRDRLAGKVGDDLLFGGAGNDILDGGRGADTAVFDAGKGAIVVDLRIAGAQKTGQGRDQLIGIENLTSAGGHDTLTGDARANVLIGGGGKDVLSGLAGHDTLQGGDGSDLLNGGAGDDILSGGSGNDTAVFVGADDIRVTLGLAGAQDTGQGHDTISGIENISSGSGNDRLTGNKQANVLDAGAGDDRLVSGEGDDTLIGGAGDDWLDPGTGRNTVIGGDGADRFVFHATSGFSRIQDFDCNSDRLLISGDFRTDDLSGAGIVAEFGIDFGDYVALNIDFGPFIEIRGVESLSDLANCIEIF